MSKCVLCGHLEFKPIYTLKRHIIERCVVCSLVRTRSIRVKEKIDYSDYYRDSDYEKYEAYFRNIFQKRYNLITKWRKLPGRVLDVGASSGVLLDIFKENGWDTWGVELSNAGNLAKKKGHNITRSSIESAKLNKDFFDVVVLNHTLEHLKDPLSVLKKIKTFTKKGGYVYIDVPNFGSMDAQIKKAKWWQLLPDEHLYHFTPSTIGKMLEKAGFEIKWTSTWSGVFDNANQLNKIWLQISSKEKHFYKNLIIDFLMLPFNVITKLLNRGTGLAAIARKA